MTIAAAFVPRKFRLPEAEQRLFRVDPFSQLLGLCHWQVGKLKQTPVIVTVHGLEGSCGFELRAGNCGEGVPPGISRGADEPAELRRDREADAYLI